MAEITNAERWAPIRGWEGRYEVSDHGRVRALPRQTRNRWGVFTLPGRLMRPGKVKGGYLIAALVKGERRENRCVHHLVIEAFVGPAPGPLGKKADEWQCNHIDGCTSNNRLDNLEWVTAKQNMEHASRLGLRPHGAAVNTAKLSEDDVRAIRASAKRGTALNVIARRFGVTASNVGSVVHRQSWQHVE